MKSSLDFYSLVEFGPISPVVIRTITTREKNFLNTDEELFMEFDGVYSAILAMVKKARELREDEITRCL